MTLAIKIKLLAQYRWILIEHYALFSQSVSACLVILVNGCCVLLSHYSSSLWLVHLWPCLATQMARTCTVVWTTKNWDKGTGPRALPFAHLLAPLTHFLAPHCSLRSSAPLRLSVCSLTHSLTPEFWENSIIRCLKMIWFGPTVTWV